MYSNLFLILFSQSPKVYLRTTIKCENMFPKENTPQQSPRRQFKNSYLFAYFNEIFPGIWLVLTFLLAFVYICVHLQTTTIIVNGWPTSCVA